MTSVTNPGEFCAALGVYFGDSASERYRPGDAVDGAERVRNTFPQSAEVLVAEIETLLHTARSLPGLWGDGALPLNEACESIDGFIGTEYAFVPAPLRKEGGERAEL